MSPPEQQAIMADNIGSGSYLASDVTFVLQAVNVPLLSIAEKERQIQSGTHYGQLLSAEAAPNAAYLKLFHQTLHTNGPRMAADVWHLAAHLNEQAQQGQALLLVSLARGGTPVGVLLKRLLTRWGRTVDHYSLSIIRDHGLDLLALRQVVEAHPGARLFFIDGWTGKGVIGRELARSVALLNRQLAPALALDPALYTLSDPGGFATFGNEHDYLLPHAMLNATVSGLISRSVLTEQGFHGTMLLENLAAHDHSRFFVDAMTALLPTKTPTATLPAAQQPKASRQHQVEQLLGELQQRFGARPLNHIKPGIGEASRVLLRRNPHLLLLRDPASADVAHLLQIASERAVRIETHSAMPFQAVALIESHERDP
jgi:hypothetical protein